MVSKSTSRVSARAYGTETPLMVLVFIAEWMMIGTIVGFLFRVFIRDVQLWYTIVPFTLFPLITIIMIFARNNGHIRAYQAKIRLEGENEYLKDIVEDLAEKIGIERPAIIMVHDNVPMIRSRANATSAIIIVSDTLVALLEADELKAVIGHEMSHIKNADPVPMYLICSMSHISAILSVKVGTPIFRFGKELFGNGVRREGGLTVADVIIKVLSTIGGAVITAAGFVLLFTYPLGTLVTCGLSKNRDYMADQGSAYVTKDPQALISALDKIQNEPVLEGWMNPVRANVSIMNKYRESSLEYIFLSIQPMYLMRVSRLESIDRTFQATGYYKERFVADEELDYAARVAPQAVFSEVCADLLDGLRTSFASELDHKGTARADFDKLEVDAEEFATLSKGYFTGTIVEEVPVKAFAYGLKAAQSDEGMMQVFTAACYGCGYGVAIDCEEARTWFKIASNNGCRNTVMSAYLQMKVYSAAPAESSEEEQTQQ